MKKVRLVVKCFLYKTLRNLVVKVVIFIFILHAIYCNLGQSHGVNGSLKGLDFGQKVIEG